MAAGLDQLRCGLLAVPMVEIARVSLGRGESRAQGDAALVHHLEHLGSAVEAMLDRVDAGEQGAPHALAVVACTATMRPAS